MAAPEQIQFSSEQVAEACAVDKMAIFQRPSAAIIIDQPTLDVKEGTTRSDEGYDNPGETHFKMPFKYMRFKYFDPGGITSNHYNLRLGGWRRGSSNLMTGILYSDHTNQSYYATLTLKSAAKEIHLPKSIILTTWSVSIGNGKSGEGCRDREVTLRIDLVSHLVTGNMESAKIFGAVAGDRLKWPRGWEGPEWEKPEKVEYREREMWYHFVERVPFPFARPEGAPETGGWYLKKDRTYIAQRDDEEILKVIPVDPDRWNAYRNARRSIHPCDVFADVNEEAMGACTCCVFPTFILSWLGCPCACAHLLPRVWRNYFKKDEHPYPEGARGKEALVLTDVGIRGWAEKKNKEGALEYEPVGIAWDNIRGIYGGFRTTIDAPGFVAHQPRAASCVCRCSEGYSEDCNCAALADPNYLYYEEDMEYNSLGCCVVILPFCCCVSEYTPCRGSASGLESYYRLTLSSASFYQSIKESTVINSDVVISARGLAEDLETLVKMIMERASVNQKTELRYPDPPPDPDPGSSVCAGA